MTCATEVTLCHLNRIILYLTFVLYIFFLFVCSVQVISSRWFVLIIQLYIRRKALFDYTSLYILIFVCIAVTRSRRITETRE